MLISIFLRRIDCLKRYQKKKVVNKKKIQLFLKHMILAMLFCTFGIWIYQTYMQIEVIPEDEKNKNVQRTSQTVKEVEEKDEKIEDILEKINQSIVGISKIKNNGSSIFIKDGVDQLGLGTGFIVSENGYIVTNEHVSGGKYSNCYVTLDTGKTYPAQVVWSDSNLDLSIIKINMKSLNYVTLGDSETARVGQSVYAIGNPIGFEFQRTVTSGIISALSRTIKFEEDGKEVFMSNLIQTDAGINPGNSGGPLINSSGEVIAINTIKIDSAEGIGFAIPINIIKPIIDRYIKEGQFEEATIGVFAYDKDVIPYLDGNLEFDSGIYVEEVIRGSAAEKAGIKVGDIIVKIDQVELEKMADLREYIYTKNVGDTVTLTVQRGTVKKDVTVILDKK